MSPNSTLQAILKNYIYKAALKKNNWKGKKYIFLFFGMLCEYEHMTGGSSNFTAKVKFTLNSKKQLCPYIDKNITPYLCFSKECMNFREG